MSRHNNIDNSSPGASATPTTPDASQDSSPKRARRRKPKPPADDVEATSSSPTPRPLSPADQAQLPRAEGSGGEADDLQKQVDQTWYDDEVRDPEAGYKKPPKKHQFKPGVSGNPSGKRRPPKEPPGNLIQGIGDEIIDELVELLQGRVRDLQPNADDLVTTALAKVILGRAFKNDGAASKFVLSQFFEKPLLSERLLPKDPREESANAMRAMLEAMFDPTMTEQEMKALVDKFAVQRRAENSFPEQRRKLREQEKRRQKAKAQQSYQA